MAGKNIYFGDDILERAQAQADVEHRSLSNLIEVALIHYLDSLQGLWRMRDGSTIRLIEPDVTASPYVGSNDFLRFELAKDGE